MTEDTFPKLLIAQAKRFGKSKVALREKDFGIWQEVTWAQYLENVKAFSLGLVRLGLERGDKISIIGDNRPEWVYAELAAQAAGGISVGLYQDSVAKEVRYVIDHSDSEFLIVEDQEQVDKIIEIKNDLPKVKKVIYYDPKGLRGYKEEFLMSFTAVLELGREHEREHPGLFEANVAAGKGSDVAIICYTSGTTGVSKGAMLTFDNLLAMGKHLTTIDPVKETDEYVSFLPLAWIGEQMMTLSTGLLIGLTVNFPEEPETAQENIREIGPHVMFSPPRIWENMVSTVQVKIEDTSAFKRFCYDLCLPVGQQMADYKFRKQKPPLWLKLAYAFANVVMLMPLRDHLGLLRIRRAYTGGAALGPDTFKFFHAIGVNLKQIYGQTEISGISVVHRDDDVKFETVGKPIPETEIMVSDTGEILSRSPSVFVGYYKQPEITAETLRDGWLHSGDAGILDEDGHLVVIDRMKDVMRLVDGTKFSPQYIENKLKFSQYVKEAVVVGQDRPYVAALINIDMANVGKWAENRQIPYTTYTDLAQKEHVYELIARDVERVNKDLPRAARIKKFVLLHKELDADDEELTRTRKVRRKFVEERYAWLIEELYGESEMIEIEADIKYRDGRQAKIQTSLKVRFVEPAQDAKELEVV